MADKMTDLFGLEIEVGQKVVVARPAGNNACLVAGTVTHVNHENGKLRYRHENGEISNWINHNSYYGSNKKVVILNDE